MHITCTCKLPVSSGTGDCGCCMVGRQLVNKRYQTALMLTVRSVGQFRRCAAVIAYCLSTAILLHV